MDKKPRQTSHEPTRRSGAVRGRYVVFATLSLFFVIPVMTYFVWSMTKATPPRTDLDYDERASWFTMDVKSRPLRYSKFVAAETGKEYKKTDLTIDPDVEQVLHRCASLVQDAAFFENAEAAQTLERFADNRANGFYPAYLLAAWHRENGDDASAERYMRIAFDRADTAIVQRLVDAKGNPVAGLALPPVAIGYDRVIDGKLDATLVLIYPRPTSEANGFIYLPVYRSAYRLADAALPLGVDPGLHPTRLTLLPQPSNGTDPNWFAVPDGAVGRLRDAVVE
ncbi:MAG: hypothetical protein ACPGYV_08840 [Phycisphaeraceae bacterium]